MSHRCRCCGRVTLGACCDSCVNPGMDYAHRCRTRLVVLCLMLSNRQWNRYEGRKDANQVQNANMSQEPTDVQKWDPSGSTVND